MLFEIFTDSITESKALEVMMNIEVDQGMKTKKSVESVGRKILGKSGVGLAKRILKR